MVGRDGWSDVAVIEMGRVPVGDKCEVCGYGK